MELGKLYLLTTLNMELSLREISMNILLTNQVFMNIIAHTTEQITKEWSEQ